MYVVVYGAILCCISSQLYSVGLEHFNSNALYLKINTQHFVAFFFFMTRSEDGSVVQYPPLKLHFLVRTP